METSKNPNEINTMERPLTVIPQDELSRLIERIYHPGVSASDSYSEWAAYWQRHNSPEDAAYCQALAAGKSEDEAQKVFRGSKDCPIFWQETPQDSPTAIPKLVR